MPVILILTRQDTAFVIMLNSELVLMKHFLHSLDPLWILLTHQQFPFKLILSLDSGAVHIASLSII